ncbi:ethylmalonyl-CoA decarboxylase-like [Diorhabda sublineata]|uniref:ethylmalonyl-CoA decarboxylase-like n=1 Tax=Diorhabda sublineata TaxID=1163346 RepID=UPI0024E12E44|nr:ethylmalonyl-CoA decarboxylase-like [Diorhabda sublineata]
MDLSNDLEYMEKFLSRYKGGEITLLKDHWDDGIAMICINHQEKRNAISGKMLTDLNKCVRELESWVDGKAVLIFSKGVNFCSGGDLDFARKENNPTAGFYMSYYMHDILKRFRKLPLVSVTLVHGVTVGGGAEISVFSDFILLADDAKLGFVHGKMGIMTAWGGATRLIQIVGQRKALEILLSSKMYNPEECLELGFVYKVVKTDNRMEEALEFIKSLTTIDSSITRSYKAVANVAVEENFNTRLELERNEFYPKWGSDLNKEALRKGIKHVKK